MGLSLEINIHKYIWFIWNNTSYWWKKGYCNWKYIEAVSLRRKKNLVLSQEEEENIAEKTNYDANINAKANTIYDNNKYMVVTMKEDKKTWDIKKQWM